VQRRRAALARETGDTIMDANRTIYLHDGRAWVAELKNGRARVWSLSAWLSAHPGRAAVRSLAFEPLPQRAPRARALGSGQARSGLDSLVGRLLGRRASPHPPETPLPG
jgi:hypothetical protein